MSFKSRPTGLNVTEATASSHAFGGFGAPSGGSVGTRVYEDLRRRIISLEFPPGTSLLRAELAKAYEVSQTPLREAMQRLEQEGLVRIFPQSKTIVSQINTPQIYEAHFMRVALETEVVRQLTRAKNQEAVMHARAVVRMQEAVADDPSQLLVFQELDELFHQTLFVGVGHRGLHQLVTSRSGHLSRMRRMQPHDDTKIRFILEGHRDILDAIDSGEEEASVSAMRAHLSQTVVNVEALRERHRDFFS
jgi:DNA-binding GntR family transcriptional regulator